MVIIVTNTLLSINGLILNGLHQFYYTIVAVTVGALFTHP